MQTYLEAHKKVFIEVISNSDEVRAEYLANYRAEANDFSLIMSEALTLWHRFEATPDDAQAALASSLAYAAITLHIQSMKLFLSGCPVAAGNLTRQVVENLALALLCAHRELSVARRFQAEQFDPRQALTEIRRLQKTLGVSAHAIACLENCQSFYQLYNHPIKMTVASYMSYSDEGLYIGAAFDEGKLAFYEQEIKRRLALAKVFPELLKLMRKHLRVCVAEA